MDAENYCWRIMKIKTTFRKIDNREHWQVEVKRRKGWFNIWQVAGWCDTLPDAVKYLEQNMKAKNIEGLHFSRPKRWFISKYI